MRAPWRSTKTTPYEQSRHAQVSRRTALQMGAAVTASAALAACSNDEDVLRDISIDADASSATPDTTETAATQPGTTSPTTSATSTTSPEVLADEPPDETAPETTAAPASAAFADGTEMVVAFTYEPTAEGKEESPYVAVWVEDADGALVHTIALWRQQNQKGLKYMRTLTRWFTVDQSRIANGGVDLVDVMSGPTRFPGAHSVAWNGMSDTIGTLAAGDYFVCVESSREDGPRSLIREPITLAAQPLDLALPDATELVGASVSVA